MKTVLTCAILAACLGLTACGKPIPEHAFEAGQKACVHFGGLSEINRSFTILFDGPEYVTASCTNRVKIEIWYKERNGITNICSTKNPC